MSEEDALRIHYEAFQRLLKMLRLRSELNHWIKEVTASPLTKPTESLMRVLEEYQR